MEYAILDTPSPIGPNVRTSKNSFITSITGEPRIWSINYINNVTVKYTADANNVDDPCYIEQLAIIQLMPTVGKKSFCNTNLSGIMKPNEEVVFHQNC